MASKEISIWIDERWYDALTKHLPKSADTLEEHLENVIDEMCNALPENEYERISREIWEDKKRADEEREAARRFGIFCVCEDSETRYFLVDGGIATGFHFVGNTLRKYLRKEQASAQAADHFWEMYFPIENISREEYEEHLKELSAHTGRVVGAYYLDLHSKDQSLYVTNGYFGNAWKGYKVSDICSAAYFAFRRMQSMRDQQRLSLFLERLNGKEIYPTNSGVPYDLGGEEDA